MINVIPSRQANPPHLKVWKEWRNIEILSYPITYSPELIEHLNRLSGKVEIIWLTTWREKAVKDFAPIVGLNTFRYINPKGAKNSWGSAASFIGAPENRWWKLNGILEHIDTVGTPFVWIDDELPSQTKKFVRRAAEDSNVPNLMFIPFETKGIDPEHIECIDKFLLSLWR